MKVLSWIADGKRVVHPFCSRLERVLIAYNIKYKTEQV